MRWVVAGTLIGLAAGAAVAQTPTAQSAKGADTESSTTLRLPEYDANDRVVVTGMVPIPDVGEGAPLFSSEDLQQLESATRRTVADTRSDLRRCTLNPSGMLIPFNPAKPPSLLNLLALEYEEGQRAAAAASKAQSATERAEEARSGAASGQVGMDVVIALELERQAAVNNLQKARGKLFEAQAMIGDVQEMLLTQRGNVGIMWSDLDLRAHRRKKDGVGIGIATPQAIDALNIQNVKASQLKDKKGKDFAVVSGDILNSGSRPAKIPALSVSLVDERGWVLTSSTVTPVQKKSIAAGKLQAFQIEMRPAPDFMQTAVVAFAAEATAEPRINVGLFCRGADRQASN